MLYTNLIIAILALIALSIGYFWLKRSLEIKHKQALLTAMEEGCFWQKKYFAIRQEMHDRFGE